MSCSACVEFGRSLHGAFQAARGNVPLSERDPLSNTFSQFSANWNRVRAETTPKNGSLQSPVFQSAAQTAATRSVAMRSQRLLGKINHGNGQMPNCHLRHFKSTDPSLLPLFTVIECTLFISIHDVIE
jgi:hypothetical protein